MGLLLQCSIDVYMQKQESKDIEFERRLVDKNNVDNDNSDKSIAAEHRASQQDGSIFKGDAR